MKVSVLRGLYQPKMSRDFAEECGVLNLWRLSVLAGVVASLPIAMALFFLLGLMLPPGHFYILRILYQAGFAGGLLGFLIIFPSWMEMQPLSPENPGKNVLRKHLAGWTLAMCIGLIELAVFRYVTIRTLEALANTALQ